MTTTPEITVTIDTRERDAIRMLQSGTAFGYPHAVEQIAVADFQIHANGRPVVLIERKTWSDLAASIKDGRTANNAKMERCRDTYGCRLVYIIEGANYKHSYFESSRQQVAHIPVKALQSYLMHRTFDGYAVHHTTDIYDTLRHVEFIAASFASYARARPEAIGGDDKPTEDTVNEPVEPPPINSREAKATYTQLVARTDLAGYLAKCPGISTYMADTIAARTGSLRPLLADNSHELIAPMTTPSGTTIGIKRARRMSTAIHNSLTTQVLFEKSLRGISGVGTKLAATVKLADVQAYIAGTGTAEAMCSRPKLRSQLIDLLAPVEATV
jgi:ERCC4-type nuclease